LQPSRQPRPGATRLIPSGTLAARVAGNHRVAGAGRRL